MEFRAVNLVWNSVRFGGNQIQIRQMYIESY